MSITKDMREAVSFKCSEPSKAPAELHQANAGLAAPAAAAFKVGDRVRCIAPPSEGPYGEAGTVEDVEYHADVGCHFYKVRFETAGLYGARFDDIEHADGRMTKAKYIAFHKECTKKMHDITKAKNADYTGKGDDPFANFTRVEALGICSTEQGFLTRMTDKMARLASFCERGELSVKDESVEDTLLDLANYAILFAGYLRSKRQ